MKQRAFTLAESLTAIFILAVALLGLMVMLVVAQRAERQANANYQVASQARAILAATVASLRLSEASFQVTQACARVPLAGHPELEYQIDETLLTPRSKSLRLTVYYKNPQGVACQSTFWTEVYNAIQE